MFLHQTVSWQPPNRAKVLVLCYNFIIKNGSFDGFKEIQKATNFVYRRLASFEQANGIFPINCHICGFCHKSQLPKSAFSTQSDLNKI